MLGGKPFFFVNYEGYRFPNATTIERTVPTALMRAGVVQVISINGWQTMAIRPAHMLR
jgi:hypothetical protein